MISFDQAILDCQNLSSDPTTAALTFFKQKMNQSYKMILVELGRPLTEVTRPTTSVAAQQAYQFPPNFLWCKSVTYTVGTIVYPLQEIEDQEAWNAINITTIQQAIPQYYFIRERFGYGGDEILLWPIPSTSSNTITLVFEAGDKDLSQTAYTTGTATINNGSATVTGSGTTWSTNMIGRYFNVTDSAGGGDGMFYRVVGVSGGTSLTLENVYDGNNVTGLTYQICEAFALPDDVQMLPEYFALSEYYGIRKDTQSELKYRGYFNQGLQNAKLRYATKSRSNIIRGKKYLSRWGMSYPIFFPNAGIGGS